MKKQLAKCQVGKNLRQADTRAIHTEAHLSERVLRRDWISVVENRAWKHLQKQN